MARLFADLTPLRVSPPFRRLWWGQGLASVGSQLTLMAVGLEIYGLTGSTFNVGLLGLAALVPTLVAGLYGGAIIDANDRRKVAMVAAGVVWFATCGIALQAWLGVGRVGLLYGLVALQAGAAAIDGSARGSIVPRLVSKELLPAANALTMVTWTIAMMTGPVAGAFLVKAVGYGPTYTIDVVTFMAALYALFRLPPVPPLKDSDADADEAPPTGLWGHFVAGLRSVGAGLRFVATRPNLRMAYVSDFAAMVLALPRTLFPAVGAVMIGGGATTAGFLTAAIALGSTLAGVLSGPLGRVRRQGLAVLVSVGVWGAGVGLFGVVLLLVGYSSPSSVIWWALAAACGALALAGAADAVSTVFRGTILQMATPDALRGRLQAVFTVVVTGGPRLGDLVSGTDSKLFGEAWAATIGGIACIVAVVAFMVFQPGFRHYDARHPEP